MKIEKQTEYHESFLFEKSKSLFIFALVFIFLVGLLIRFYDLKDAPLDFHPTRQLYSAIKARGMFYETETNIVEWKKELAVKLWKSQGIIEPPIMEWLSATSYKIFGQEILWIPRILSIMFWTIGGIFLVKLVQSLADKNAAIFALLFYMVTPYTAIASRAFQPDPLMVMFLIISLWRMVCWIEKDSIKNAVLGGIFAGIAILIKSVVIFPIAFGFIGIVFSEKKNFKSIIRSRSIWIMGILSILPYLSYMVYCLLISGELQSQFNLRFFPQLWIDPVFWLRWIEMIDKVVVLEFFIAAIIGIFLLNKQSHRILLSALFFGYFVYGMTLPYHMSTHDYYQLPLVPLVAIGVSIVFSQIINGLKITNWLSTLVILAIMSMYLFNNAWNVRVTLARENFDNEIQFWEGMQKIFNPDDKLIGITQDYGYRLNYWGWTNIENWMSTYDFSVRELAGQNFDYQTLFDEQTDGMDYFLVTQLSELDNQPIIKQLLFDNYRIYEETDDFIIFDLKAKLGE